MPVQAGRIEVGAPSQIMVRPGLKPSRAERGISLLLAMLVLLVLIVVVFQVRFSASVEIDQARTLVATTRYRMIAAAAAQQARAALMLDVDAAAAADEEGGGGLFGGDPTAGGGEGDSESDEDAEEQRASVAEVTAATDSKLDEWRDPMALAPPVGSDLDLVVEVEDEDGKLNLMGLWTEDEEARLEHREVVRRLLDEAWAGTTLDLSYAETVALLDEFDDWVRGDRGYFNPVPKPKLKIANADEAEEDDGAADDEGEDDDDEDDDPEEEVEPGPPPAFGPDERNYPLTLGELMLVQGQGFQHRGLVPEHFTGFVENDEFYPGLDRYLSLYSNLELKAKPDIDDEFSDSPFGAVAGDETQIQESDVTETRTNNGLVNINAAPLPVLRAIAGDEIPGSFLEKLVEFRDKIDEFRADPLSTQSLLDAGGAFGATEEEEDVTRYVFQTTDEIFDKVEEEFFLSTSVEEQTKNQFANRFSVESHVFTIRVLVNDPQTGARGSFRTVVWRVQTDDGPLCVTVLPLEPYHDPRRLEDLEADLEDLGEFRARAIDQLGMPPL